VAIDEGFHILSLTGKMADDLMFPPSDPLSLIGDFDENLLQNDTLLNNLNTNIGNDLNPSFLQSELLNIPPLVPAIVSPTTEQKINVRNAMLQAQYTPISQLMKQTEQLSQTLDSPLAPSSLSAARDQLAFHNNQQVPKQLLNNNGNTFQTQINNSSSQCLVVGGQRIQIPPQNSMPLHNNIMSLQQRQQQQQALIQQQILQQQLRLQQQQQIGVQQLPLITNSNIHQNNLSPMSPHSLNLQTNNVQVPALRPDLPLQQTQINNIKSSTNPDANKPPLKGQIVKTADQRLMFVTELNGKRVAYYIQQSTNNLAGPTQTSPFNSTAPSQQLSSTSVTMKNDFPNNNQSLTSLGRSSNNPITIDSEPIPTSIPGNNILNSVQQQSKLPSATTNLNSIPQVTEQETLSKVEELSKKEEFTKSLRDKLISLRSNPSTIKVNVPSYPSANNNKVEENVDEEMEEDIEEVFSKPATPQMPTPTDIPPTQYLPSEKYNTNENRNTENIFGEEDDDDEDGQEIEFSENDLSLNTNDKNDVESPTYDNIVQDSIMLSNHVSTDDDDESVPLSVLKAEAADDLATTANQIIQEELAIDSTSTKKSKTAKKRGSDSLPLSVVAASLKKSEEPKKKGKTKGKKKKKDKREPPRPLFAYQVFFRDVQGALREKNPQLTFGELSRLIAQMWEKLEEDRKKVYQEDYQAAKVEYEGKMVEFKDMIAKEALASPSPLSPTDGNDNISPAPKKGNKRGPKKKITKKKGGANNDGGEVTPTSESPDLFFKLEEKMDIDQDGNPSSPSLPSSDSSSEDSDREDTIIIQMKRKAEELEKKIKIEKKAVNKKKLAKEAKKANRGVTRMEVETISETETLFIELETGSPQKQVVQIIPPKTTEPKLIVAKPSDSKPPDAKQPDPKQTETSPEPKPETPQLVKSKPTRPTKLSRLKKIKSLSPSPEQVLSPTAESSPPPPLKIKKVEIPEDSSFLPVSKQTFKIPKKAGANTSNIPPGPRLCVRKECGKPAKTTRERGGQYCSNDCLVYYCREVFDSWVLDRQQEEEGKT